MLRRMRALPFVLSVAATAACNSDDPDDPPVDRPRTFGGDRPVILQVPVAFDEAQQYPLLLVLHGFGANGFLQQGYLKLNGVADRAGMFVLAPDGTTNPSGMQFWNADPACCDFGRSGVDDVAYLGGLIDAVAAAWPVDPARVAVVGHSNGAFMAYRLACDRADVVTAIAGLAGHATSTACAPTQRVHVLHIHGTVDDTVPYESGVFGGVQSPGAVDSVAQWASHNGCAGGPSPSDRKDLESGLPGTETAVDITTRCPAAGGADLWTIEGGNHIPPLTTTFPDELLAWFAAHER